ncbi:carbohydrate-binding module family 21 protein [Hydnomerulius pinastri MD-312]|uniref:Carbohydrate-binding module family 21 protein n=1 Tax=Hydnomerulius pinastri MD-312 TaxID=994086 RepID=A0A0C9VYB7_9AGAM|nr:carbohydrate-binding module family 21 protein [Hydnomerulius pinastri MD-312]
MSSTVCVTDTSVIPFPTVDSTYTQSSNTAGRPLPHIPRRNSRSGHVQSFSESALTGMLETSLPPPLAIHSPTGAPSPPFSSRFGHMRYDSESSSSSSTPSDEIRPTIIPRSKRVPHQRSIPTDSPDIFTPITPNPTPIKPRADTHARFFADIESRKQTPLRDTSDDDTTRPVHGLTQAPFCKVGKLRLEGVTGKHVRHSSDSRVSTARVVVTADAQPSGSSETRAIRKKSGEPVKSSLKSARRPVLSVVTGGNFAKSEPSTPTHTKAVHFDSKLEHVKLFLAEQKPLAVSRDGSPTTDTSGTDDFPAFIYGDGSRGTKQIKMLVPNMPSSPRKDGALALQELVLSQDQRTITGKVLVRNIAYEKWLAVRFTLDWWQTTSEVTARYKESIENGTYDIFTFSIRLHDMWTRIEEKTIFLALRYTVAGKEFWDNNAGQNYHIKFVPAPVEPPTAADSEASDITLSDLNSRLEEVAKARSSHAPVAPYHPKRSFSAGYVPPSLTSGKSLSSRYDFASAYKTPWVRPTTPPAASHVRTHTYPSTPGQSTAPWSNAHKSYTAEQIPLPKLRPAPLVSPREMGLMHGTPPLPSRTAESQASEPETPSPSCTQDGRERNHRRGYFERVMGGSPNIKRTPTGSPLKFGLTHVAGGAGHLTRPHSFPLTDNMGPLGSANHLPTKLPLSIQTTHIGDGDSEGSTPSVTSQSSSSSTPLMSPRTDALMPEAMVNSPSQGDDYKQFLNQFCFYTGADSLLEDSSEILPRSHSASSIEQFLLSHSPPTHSFISHIHDLSSFSPPTRSSSFDGVTRRSGSVTPTGRQLLKSESRSATPIVG